MQHLCESDVDWRYIVKSMTQSHHPYIVGIATIVPVPFTIHRIYEKGSSWYCYVALNECFGAPLALFVTRRQGNSATAGEESLTRDVTPCVLSCFAWWLCDGCRDCKWSTYIVLHLCMLCSATCELYYEDKHVETRDTAVGTWKFRVVRSGSCANVCHLGSSSCQRLSMSRNEM